MSASTGESIRAKTLAAAAMPFCTVALTLVSRLSGENSSAIAVKKLTKSLMAIAPLSNRHAERSRMIASANAVIICAIGAVAAAAAANLTWNRLARFAASANRRVSYAWPEKTLTTLWPSMLSCKTWVTSPIVRCSPCDIRRSRRLK